jgi:predicted O-methyltransferase YrrM
MTSATLAHYTSMFRSFADKSRCEQFQALKATIRHHYRSVTGQPTKWQDDSAIQKVMIGEFVPPTVLGSKSRLYFAYRPDSDVDYEAYPELHALSEKWVWKNSFNNAGDLPRLYALSMNIKQVLNEGVPGDVAELGVYRGNSAAVLAHYARQHNRAIFLFDTFQGFDTGDITGVDASKTREFADTSLDLVREIVGDEAVTYVKGYFPGSITDTVAKRHFAIVHVDCDLYEPMKAALEFFYPRLSSGGLMILHDYGNPCWVGAKQVVDEFLVGITDNIILIPDKSETAMIRKARSLDQLIRRSREGSHLACREAAEPPTCPLGNPPAISFTRSGTP